VSSLKMRIFGKKGGQFKGDERGKKNASLFQPQEDNKKKTRKKMAVANRNKKP